MIDKNLIKHYLIENPSEVQRVLEFFGFHDFSIKGRELRCALPDRKNETTVAVNLNTLYCNVFAPPDFKGDLFGMLIHWNENFGDGYQWDFYRILKIVDEKILHITTKGKEKQFQYPKKFDCSKSNESEGKSKKEPEIYGVDFLNSFIRLPYINWVREGILPFIQDKYCICYDDRWSRILIPHFKYDDKTKIVGVQGRTSIENYDLLGIPKYTNYIEGYEKSKNIYGLSHNIEDIRDKRQMVIFEGEKSVMKLESYYHAFPYVCVPSVALGGSSLSDWQAECIGQLSKGIDCLEVIVCMDKDVEKKYVLSTCKKLMDSGCDHVSYILDDNGLLDDKDSPIDKGLKLWQVLFDGRKGTS